MKNSKLQLFSVLLLSVLFIGCDSVKRNNSNPMTTVDSVDISRFQGTWHVAARMPSFFEKNCKNSSATYSATSDSNVIQVQNVCDSIDDPGSQDVVRGKATVQNSSNSKFKIRLDRFPGNLADGNLWVINKDVDYKWIILSEPEGRYLWIMGRDEKMQDNLLQELINWVEADGWDVDALINDNQ